MRLAEALAVEEIVTDTGRTDVGGHRMNWVESGIRKGKMIGFKSGFFILLLLGSTVSAATPPITALVFSPNGESVVAASQSGLQILDWPSLRREKTINTSLANLHRLCFSPDGNRLPVGGGQPAESGNVEILAWPSGELETSFDPQSDSVTSVVWKDNSRLLAASLDRDILMLNTQNVDFQRRYSGHSQGVSALCLLKDGKTLLSAGTDQSVRVWDCSTAALVCSLNQHLAAADRTIRFWQPTIGRMMRSIRLTAERLDIVWFKDGSRIVAACVDGRIRVIHPENVMVTGGLAAIDGWACAVAIHPTDPSLMVGGTDGAMRCIQLSTAKKNVSERR